ncbi:hypothetical protein ZHAS_00000867 [Anopheles sinensis]|uniref:Uncharacterized protein n=1 Tax=Anopheles sinensis TaxID=74873 RepID=A0A084VAQ3_ANOSI|nr:hypothetical protein ZHAS_00000867 [Anopheles sinensis]
MRPPPLHRFLEQPAFNHHHHYASARTTYGGSNGGTPGVASAGGGGSGGGGLGGVAGSGTSSGGGGGGSNSGNGKSSSVNYSASGTSLHSHHHHHHQASGGSVGGGGVGAGNMTINTSAESSSDYKPNLALSDYTNTTDWTNGLGAPSSTSYMNTFSPLQTSPPSYVAYESCPMVDHPNYGLAATGDNTQPYQDYYALSGPPPPPVAAVVPSAANSQAQLGGTGQYVGKSGDLMEAGSYSYPHHPAQWTNGYHGGYHHHQYQHPTVATAPGCTPSLTVATQPAASFHTPAAAPPPPPPMVLCPQMFSTVNQNQIHVHLHGSGSEKFEHYFGSTDNGFTINSFPGTGIRSVAAPVASSLSDIGIGSHQDSGAGGAASDTLTALLSAHHEDSSGTHQHQPQQQTSGQEQLQDESERSEESVAGDPSSVWRPY